MSYLKMEKYAYKLKVYVFLKISSRFDRKMVSQDKDHRPVKINLEITVSS